MSDANNEVDANNSKTNPSDPPDSSMGDKRKREVKTRSKVWFHFTKVPPKPGERDECKCNYCNKFFSCPSKGGTTHLLRHIDNRLCHSYNKLNPIEGNTSQSVLKFEKGKSGEDCILVPWKFDQERSRKNLSELVICAELSFSFGEHPAFQKYIHGICPKYQFNSRATVRSDCMKRYKQEKYILKGMLQSSKCPRICLTTDTWTSRQDLPFLALTAHFIDNGWKLHKRIVNFVMVPMQASDENLADVIISCLLEWNVEKICTITMDNHTANDVIARNLADHSSSRGLLLLGGAHIQVRCWAHVLNLCIQDGLNEIKDSIRRVRNAVKYVKGSGRRKLEFLKYADQERIPRGKMLVIDMPTRWNSTYLMLGAALHYKKAYERMKTRDPHFKNPPNSKDWEKAEIVHQFLEAFFIVAKVSSSTNSCTANLFFREVYRILILLRETSLDLNSLLGRMALNMLVKFEKYWAEKEPNILLSIALILDPRFKDKYLKFCYSRIYGSSTVDSLMARVDNIFRDLFDEYKALYEASTHLEEINENDKERDDMSCGTSSTL